MQMMRAAQASEKPWIDFLDLRFAIAIAGQLVDAEEREPGPILVEAGPLRNAVEAPFLSQTISPFRPFAASIMTGVRRCAFQSPNGVSA